jgi:hypothetical protein
MLLMVMDTPPEIHAPAAPRELCYKFYLQEEDEYLRKDCYTIIADGDWTLYESSSSHVATFEESPAKEAVLKWIRSGIKTDAIGRKLFSHQLILATGGDFEMTKARFMQCLPSDVKPAVTVVTNAGARLFYYDVEGVLQEDKHYSAHAVEGGVAINKETELAFTKKAVELLNIFFAELKKNPQLQQEVESAPYGDRIRACADLYPEKGFPFEEFSKERIVHGIYKDLNLCPRIEIREMETGQPIQISIIGIFSNLPSLQHHEKFQECLQELVKISGSIAPSQNLCVLEISRTNKGTLLHYLGLNPERSVGMGDAPEANDKPLTEYVAKTPSGEIKQMPFISVAKEDLKDRDVFYHVGQQVTGSQKFFEALLEEQEQNPQRSFMDLVKAAQEKAKGKV